MKSVLKVIGVGVLLLIAIPVVVYAAVVLCNLRDDELDPGAAKLLAIAPTPIPAGENGYFAWIGVVGPETEPPDAWGMRWFEEALAADKKATETDGGAILAIESEKRKDGVDAKLVPCNRPETCLAEVAARPELARAALVKGNVTLARRDAAIALPAYQEAWRPDFSAASSMPAYPVLWRQLSATRFALAVTENRHDEALKQLGKEMAFHTRQMQGAVTLIEKLVALGYLRNDYLLLNHYLLRHPEAAGLRAEDIAALLAPLPPDAGNMRTVMETEWLMGARLFSFLQADITSILRRNPPEESHTSPLGRWIADTLAFPLFLPNATTNEFYRQRSPLIAVDSQSGPAYRQALADVSRQRELEAKSSVFAMRNPVGHILVLVGAADFSSYFLRRDDLLVLRAAISIQFDLLRQNVTDSNAVTQAITAAGLAHPFTGTTPTWDAAARTLTYPALRERKNQPLAINL
jgi:hypothetical protein